MKRFSAALLLLWLVGCHTPTTVAPVEEHSHASVAAVDQYRVRTGDTLYSVAWAYHLDYRQLAGINHLHSPYTIHLGQTLSLKANAQTPPVAAVEENLSDEINHPVNAWQWPTQGKVVKGFSHQRLGNQGVNIAGRLQNPVYASAAGKVVYSGQGIRGYGKLLIIKHNAHYLSAYAFNWRNLVQAGDSVKAGQQIALMGRNDDGQTLLHFEIRYNGKPVNPLHYLN